MKHLEKRFFAFSLVLALMVSLAGCGGSAAFTSTSTAKSEATVTTADPVIFPLETPVKMSMFAIINQNIEIDDTEAFKIMGERTNVTWDVSSAGPAEIVEKRGIMLSTGQYPDVLMKSGASDQLVEQYADENIFIPLNDYIDNYMPNLKKIMQERPEVAAAMTSLDGNIYSLPQIVCPGPNVPNYWINHEWLENLELEEPESVEDLYTVLKAFKDEDANGNGDPDDEIPFGCNSEIPLMTLLTYFGVAVDPAGSMTVQSGETLEYVPTMDEYKEMLEFLTTLYSEGLLDVNTFSQNNAQMNAIGMSENIYGSFINMGPQQTVTSEQALKYYYVRPFMKDTVFATAGVTNGAFVVTDHCEHPEIACAWADYFYSEEGGFLAWYGVEGKSHELTENRSAVGIINIDTQFQYRLQGSANLPVLRPELKRADPIQNHHQTERDDCYNNYGFIPVNIKYTQEQREELSILKTSIDPYVSEYLAKVVTGELVLGDSWDKYVKNLNMMGLEDLMKINQAAYSSSK